MERVLYLEPVGGIAGDMFLAASIELGVAAEALAGPLAGLGIPGWRLKTEKASRFSICGTHLDVLVEPSPRSAERSLPEIRNLIDRAPTLSSEVKGRAGRIFQILGEAEAKVHGVPLDQVHFHEVGAVDSIVDICGAAVAVELLGNPTVFAAPPPLGSGAARSAHGPIPIPGPATLEILRDVPVRFEGTGELTTPTGAAILKALASIGPPPEMIVEKVGYGVGTQDWKDRPNVLRASLGKFAHAGADGTFVVEANLDDCTPQILGGLVQQLLELGALDAYLVPATMKKSRPGHLLAAVVPASVRDRVVEAILAESTSIGVRWHRVERYALERQWVEVDTPFGRVRMKVATSGGRELNASPEYEDCQARARERGVPVKAVWAEAVANYRRKG